MFVRGVPWGIALMAWSTVAWGGNSILAGVALDEELDVDELDVEAPDIGVVAAASEGAGVDAFSRAAAGFSAGGASLAAEGCAMGVSGGGVELELPPHAANPNSSGNTNAPALAGSAWRARN